MGPSFIVRVGTWNTMWATPTSPRGRRIRAALKVSDCDVLCVTEGFVGIFPDVGHVIKASQGWGYSVKDDRRKVLLWSKRPWADTDDTARKGYRAAGSSKAVTQAAAGTILTIVGVCIPWRGAHCNSGRKDRKPGQDHRAWLAEFARLRSTLTATRFVVLGDFNQRIPRQWIPRSRLPRQGAAAGARGARDRNCGQLVGSPRPTIDHIAHSLDLKPLCVKVWLDKDAGGMRLSDHLGAWGDFSLP